jgi:hypothetical protein
MAMKCPDRMADTSGHPHGSVRSVRRVSGSDSHEKTLIEPGISRGCPGCPEPSGSVRRTPGANRPGCVSVRSRTPPGRAPVRREPTIYPTKGGSHHGSRT